MACSVAARPGTVAALGCEEMDEVSQRRAMGALEAEVLEQLWGFGRPATPSDVLDGLDSDLAYTTIMTILTRLWEKGLVTREREGRAFAYLPVFSEAELAAQRMQELLDAAHDRRGALTKFVETLSARDARSLRAMLGRPRR